MERDGTLPPTHYAIYQRFEFLRRIGEGVYGVVWECRNKQSGEHVAVKCLKEAHLELEIMKMTAREIRMMELSSRGGSHPNILHLYDALVDRTSGRLYLVTEMVSGGSLDQLIKQHPMGLPPNLVKLIMWQLIEATQYLHSIHIMHRDLKPSNVLISKDGSLIKLCDFGFARQTLTAALRQQNPLKPRYSEDVASEAQPESECHPQWTCSKSPLAAPFDLNICGRYSPYVTTRWYRSPELLEGKPYGPPADIWALGCILYELMTGKPAYPGSTSADQLFKVSLGIPGTLNVTTSLQGHTTCLKVEYSSTGSCSILSDCSTATGSPGLSTYFTADVLQVLEACLNPESNTRLSAWNLMELPYFQGASELVMEGSELHVAYSKFPIKGMQRKRIYSSIGQ